MSSQALHSVRLAAAVPITLASVDHAIAKGWMAAVKRGLVGLSDVETDAVFSRVGPQLDQVLELAERIDAGSRVERLVAVDKLIERTGVDSYELIDFAVAAVRLGIRAAAEASRWAADFTEEVESRAVDALLEFDRQIEALATELRADCSLAPLTAHARGVG